MFEVRKLGENIGAEVRGVDITRMDDHTFSRIYRTFLDSIVIVVRDQNNLKIEDYLAYSERFGPLKPHIFVGQRHLQYPNLMLLDNQVADQRRESQATFAPDVLRSRGDGWHTDLSFEKVPAKATQLYPVILPSSGGDTKFASSYAAYDALPERLKERIESLTGNYISGGRAKRTSALLKNSGVQAKPVTHSVLKVHPETGRRCMYLDPRKILEFNDMDEQESLDLVEELSGYLIQPGYVYQHQWRPGDLVIWDNRCAMHAAVGGYPPDERRLLWRVTIMDYGWHE